MYQTVGEQNTRIELFEKRNADSVWSNTKFDLIE